jgi:hypothetical protein
VGHITRCVRHPCWPPLPRAQASGAAFTIDTQGEVLRDPLTGADFVLRVSTALQHKPAGEKASGCALCAFLCEQSAGAVRVERLAAR